MDDAPWLKTGDDLLHAIRALLDDPLTPEYLRGQLAVIYLIESRRIEWGDENVRPTVH